MNHEVINSDNITALKNYPDNYFDSIVTDPPYGLGKEPDANQLMKDWIEKGYYEIKGTGFMGKEWDAFVPQPLFWKEVFRVLKPGGHCLAFYGTRTYDWGVMAMRFAGFEVRDCIQWLYGSGFPKSHNIGKAIDKIEGNQREIVGKNKYASRRPNPMNGQTYMMNETGWDCSKNLMETKGNTKWEGWGSALKPANEPIVLARKPLEKGLSIAENVLKWGTGGINIDGCRIGTIVETWPKTRNYKSGNVRNRDIDNSDAEIQKTGESPKGRFPANIILDEEAAELLDEQSGVIKGQFAMNQKASKNNIYGGFNSKSDTKINDGILDVGGASRFFYVAKASKSERNKGVENNFHPTVKPIKLMQYLVRLITPPNGIVLDPFCGSGTTGVACKLEGFNFIGIEQDAEYCKIAEARIKGTILEAKQNELF